MNNRKFKSDKAALIAEGKRIASTSDDPRYLRKVTIVNLVLGGMKAREVAEACGKTARTVTMWVRAVDEKGFEALRPQKPKGRPCRLTDAQKEEIKTAVTASPEDCGYSVWDAPTLSDHILNKYGIVYSARQSLRLLHSLGFSLIRPQKFPSKGVEDCAAREEFKKNSTN